MTTETTQKKVQYSAPRGYVGLREMCELFGRHRWTINQMVEDGRLPKPLKDGCRNIWDRKEIMSWLEHAKFTK